MRPHQNEEKRPHHESDRDDAVEEGEVGRDVGEVVHEDDPPDEDEGETVRHHATQAQWEHARAHYVGCNIFGKVGRSDFVRNFLRVQIRVSPMTG